MFLTVERPPVSVRSRFAADAVVVRAATEDDTLLTGWLAPTAGEARQLLASVDFSVEPLGEGTEVAVALPAQADELAARRRANDWQRRLADLGELLRGRPKDWDGGSVQPGDPRQP